MNRGRHKNSANKAFQQLYHEYANTILHYCSVSFERKGRIIYHYYWSDIDAEAIFNRIRNAAYSNKANYVYIKCTVYRHDFFDTKTYTIKLKQ